MNSDLIKPKIKYKLSVLKFLYL